MTATIAPPTDPRIQRPSRPVAAPPPPPPAPAPSRSAASWSKRWAAVSLVAAVGTLIFTREPLFIIGLLFVAVVPFERLFPRHRGQPFRRPQLAGDIAHALVSPAAQIITAIVAFPLAIASLAWLPGLAVRPLVAMIPPAVMPFVAVALFDFVVYWTHRWGHEVPFFWRFHAIHHSTEHLDWVSGFRNHPLDGVFLAPAFVFLLAAGFDPEVAGILVIIQIVTGLFLHANVRWRWRPLHRVVITPEFHHWHHSNERDAHCSNYSVFLPLWDIIFGTYFMPKDRRPAVYGVDEEIPVGLVPQLLHPLRGMGNPLRHVRHPLRATRSGAGHVRELSRQMWRSARRPTGRR